mgnify:CR=1 FL=1
MHREPVLDRLDQCAKPFGISVKADEIVHVTEISLGFELPQDEMVQTVQIYIGAELTREISDGEPALGPLTVPALSDRDLRSERGRTDVRRTGPGVV